MNFRIDYCDEYYHDGEHKFTFLRLGMQCDKCCEAFGHVQCHGCDNWFDPEKMTTQIGFVDHLFCKECIDDNVHPCADPDCDGVQFGDIQHCNLCIGNAIKQTA